MEVTADDRVLVAMRDSPECKEALAWAIKEFGGKRGGRSVCLLLTHVVTELRNTAGKVVKLSEADGPSVAVHICDRVLPYLEGLQDICDDARIPSTVHVIKNENKGEGIMEAALKLEATHVILAANASKPADSWSTISFCCVDDRVPPGCCSVVVQGGRKIRAVHSKEARPNKDASSSQTPAFHGTAQKKLPGIVEDASGEQASRESATLAPAVGSGVAGEAIAENGKGAAESSAEDDNPEGLSALELARRAYQEAQKKQQGEAKAKEEAKGAVEKKKSSKSSAAAKARLEKTMASREFSGKKLTPKESNPLTARISNLTAESNARTGFKEFSLPELQAAMDHFWPNHVCGEGSYGVVYKGLLNGDQVAIKQLKNPDARAALDEIEREVEVQKRIDHSNLVRLLGYCIEDRSLVYEFMSNGSLEDRLLCIGGTPPLMWPDRCRIAMEVAAGLQHLHTRSPPIVHRDVKPANILLDDNFTAKLGDVGLARLMGDLAPGHSHVVRKSVIVGTEHYVDPEYLCARRGYLGPKSDTYSFGVVLLQMLVGEVPNLRKIDAAVEKEELGGLLDPRAGEWPMDLAMDLANLGLWCSEIDRRDRPDLAAEVIPALLEICEAAAREVIEWEKKQIAIKEKVKAEAAAKAAAEKKAAEERAAAAASAAKEQKPASKPETKATPGSAPAEESPKCCVIL